MHRFSYSLTFPVKVSVWIQRKPQKECNLFSLLSDSIIANLHRKSRTKNKTFLKHFLKYWMSMETLAKHFQNIFLLAGLIQRRSKKHWTHFFEVIFSTPESIIP